VSNALSNVLDKCLTAIFRRIYANHAVLHNLQASYQHSRFPIILQAMQLAKEEVHSISTIAHSSAIGQALRLDILAFPSQAVWALPITWMGTPPMVVPLVDTSPMVVSLVDTDPMAAIAWTGQVDPKGSATLDDVIAALVARAPTLR
jgi:hypothetical protein